MLEQRSQDYTGPSEENSIRGHFDVSSRRGYDRLCSGRLTTLLSLPPRAASSPPPPLVVYERTISTVLSCCLYRVAFSLWCTCIGIQTRTYAGRPVTIPNQKAGVTLAPSSPSRVRLRPSSERGIETAADAGGGGGKGRRTKEEEGTKHPA